MSVSSRLSQVFKSADRITFDDSSRIVIISDCHRGDASWADNFARNQNIYFQALRHYYDNNFVYMELGDGDELWENKTLREIIGFHSHVFWLLSRFFHENRLYFIYGNHDMLKGNANFVKKHLYTAFDEVEQKNIPLFPNVKVHEGLVLQHRDTNCEMLLVHGHQGDTINDRLWKLGRFLVRYFWKPLELFGVNDPTRAAKNYTKKIKIEMKLIEWVKNEKKMLVAGHTHRPVFPEIGEPPYFNDGSCVHPRCMTALEIVEGNIQLVKWSVRTKSDGTLFIDREALTEPKKLCDYCR